MIEHLSSASGVTKVNGILRNIDSFDVHLNADLAPSLTLWFRLVVRNSPFASTKSAGSILRFCNLDSIFMFVAHSSQIILSEQPVGVSLPLMYVWL